MIIAFPQKSGSQLSSPTLLEGNEERAFLPAVRNRNK